MIADQIRTRRLPSGWVGGVAASESIQRGIVRAARLFHFLEVGVNDVFLFALAGALGPRRAAIAAGRSVGSCPRPALSAGLTRLAVHRLGELMRCGRERLGRAI